MLLLLIIIPLLFFTLLYCNRLTVEPTARFRALHHGFNSTRSQGLAGFNSNMAAGLSNSTKELGFFYMIWRPTSNWKVFRYHLQRRIVIPSYFITAEVHNNWPFYEKGEAYCTDCSHAWDVPFIIRPPPMDERIPTSRVWPGKDSYQSSMAK